MPVAVAALAQLSLLAALPPPELARLAGLASERSYARREVVFDKGDRGQYLCFLLEGRLQAVDFTVDGREVGLYFVDAGDYFGELSVIDGEPQAEYMIAVTKARVAFLPRQEARSLILNRPELAGQVMTRIARRLRAISAQRTLLALPNPAQRICAQLVQLAAGQSVIAPVPTHQEIAIMINTSRETVTRVFQVLQNRHAIRREGHQLHIEDAAYLSAVAHGEVEPPKVG